MKSFLSFLLVVLAATYVNGFSAATSGLNGGSSFCVAQRQRAFAPPVTRQNKSDMSMMGGKKAKFGIFSPAVYAAKIILGEPELNKLRGKGISLHSSAIGDFCKWSGAYHLRTKLIKKAKTNGDILGFLV